MWLDFYDLEIKPVACYIVTLAAKYSVIFDRM